MIKNGVYRFYFASCMNIIFNELCQQRVKYDDECMCNECTIVCLYVDAGSTSGSSKQRRDLQRPNVASIHTVDVVPDVGQCQILLPAPYFNMSTFLRLLKAHLFI